MKGPQSELKLVDVVGSLGLKAWWPQDGLEGVSRILVPRDLGGCLKYFFHK